MVQKELSAMKREAVITVQYLYPTKSAVYRKSFKSNCCGFHIIIYVFKFYNMVLYQIPQLLFLPIIRVFKYMLVYIYKENEKHRHSPSTAFVAF